MEQFNVKKINPEIIELSRPTSMEKSVFPYNDEL